MHTFSQKHKKGFTLVETLVAISVLSLSILGTFTAVQNGLQQSTFARDQITAFYLTQEAFEFMRNKRDENALNSISAIQAGGTPVNWLHGISENAGDPCYFGNVCKLDMSFPTPTIVDCVGTGNCGVLNENSTTGLYGYSTGGSWLPTHFTREISLVNVNPDKEIKVKVKLSWVSGSFSKTLNVEESLFNNR